MTQPQIVFLDRDTIAPHITLPKPDFVHEWINYGKTAADDVTDRLAGATIAITNKVRITADVLSSAPQLKLIAVAATGYDCVDVQACAERGIAVCNIRGYSVNTVPEHVFALILALRRGLVPYVQGTRDGAWQRAGQFCYFDTPIRDLSGAVMGIIGRGAIGQKVAALAQAFGMEVIFAARPGAPSSETHVEFDSFLARADVISLHCPLTDSTRGLLGAAAFTKMTRAPVVINTARGALIDLPALQTALATRQISGVGLDVAATEPPAADDLLMDLAQDPRVLLTPHIAWASDEAQSTLASQLIDVLNNFHAGHPINLLT
ncbi:glycerate dehydrogenase [Thioclava sp. SK-1]|uniref:D-2-hydroxyacid dehydrogenase n=1 Tax=Thioclava sp. SK-1 TaxID=1889770 RepID=UPI000826944F|nr:D-2-hydroxyacid dehydrogenase [Thioclava sp. SK-1]OCX67331.1 glycerate dehydrogenase [Thioclava sp. SK-1]